MVGPGRAAAPRVECCDRARDCTGGADPASRMPEGPRGRPQQGGPVRPGRSAGSGLDRRLRARPPRGARRQAPWQPGGPGRVDLLSHGRRLPSRPSSLDGSRRRGAAPRRRRGGRARCERAPRPRPPVRAGTRCRARFRGGRVPLPRRRSARRRPACWYAGPKASASPGRARRPLPRDRARDPQAPKRRKLQVRPTMRRGTAADRSAPHPRCRLPAGKPRRDPGERHLPEAGRFARLGRRRRCRGRPPRQDGRPRRPGGGRGPSSTGLARPRRHPRESGCEPLP